MKSVPWLPLLMIVLAVMCAVAGIALGFDLWRPERDWLAADGAALALIVSAAALAGSAAFPLVIRRLVANDRPADQ
ncbi:hypothetical protein GCM10025771_12530 [Niveibacterium umoris]|uniref:L-asparagine transporter-like permease n=1 Tax=Niveibacterium umoris TaxID=1193620 RepID=A0A840BNF0_9RHOO|nr:hypothetical protein [Niveibacterium umoris]MBB4013192.1 L-asparagine transporter-like permease [Niveibacterium umoris]